MSPHPHVIAITNCYTPKEAVEICGRTGTAKANMRIDKMVVSSVLAGMLLSFACAALLSTNAAPWFQENAPGLIRTIAALIFPFGLTMVIVTGTDLCTGSFMLTTVAALQRRISVPKMLLHWFVTFWGNMIGCLFVVGIIVGYGGVFSKPVYTNAVFDYNNTKVVVSTWHGVFLRAIGANWLVCMAAFLAGMAKEYFSKVVAIWFPTFAFVCLGFDHVVANMFFVPTSIFLGDPNISVGFYIWKSLIPSLFGNIVGGALFVGVAFWYIHVSGDSSPTAIDGMLYPMDQIPTKHGNDHSNNPTRDSSTERKCRDSSPEGMV